MIKTDVFSYFRFCGYTFEPPHLGGSYEYTQQMFWSQNKKIMFTPVNPK